MKQLIIIGAFLFIMGCSLSSKESGKTGDKKAGIELNKDYKVFDDKLNGFSIAYPAKWDTANKYQKIAFIAKENDSDTLKNFTSVIDVSILQNFRSSLQETVDKYTTMAVSHYKNADFSQTKQINENDIEFIVLEIKHERHGLHLITYSTFFSNEANVYTVNMTIESSKKDRYQTILNYVNNSFNWLPN